MQITAPSVVSRNSTAKITSGFAHISFTTTPMVVPVGLSQLDWVTEGAFYANFS